MLGNDVKSCPSRLRFTSVVPFRRINRWLRGFAGYSRVLPSVAPAGPRTRSSRPAAPEQCCGPSERRVVINIAASIDDLASANHAHLTQLVTHLLTHFAVLCWRCCR